MLLKDTALTPWTNSSIVGVSNISGVVQASLSFAKFKSEMNSKQLPFEYDHAVAIME
jgi:hypothetical protein